MRAKGLITGGVIQTLYDCVNNFYSFYMVAVVVMVVGMALELKCIVETNLIRVNYCCISLHFCSYSKQ